MHRVDSFVSSGGFRGGAVGAEAPAVPHI